MKKFALICLLTPYLAFAEEVSQPAWQASLEKIIVLIPTEIPGMVLIALGFAVEAMKRLWPTIKPKSLLLDAAKIVGLVIGTLGLLKTGLEKVSGLLDKVAQNVKDPE